MNSEISTAYVTVGSKEEAEKIGRNLVQEKLVACANIYPQVQSIYMWDGQLEQSSEVVLMMKTKTDLFEKLKDRVLELHSYDCPCIVMLPITRGHQPYLDWINANTI